MMKNLSLAKKGLIMACLLLAFQILLFVMLASLRTKVLVEEAKMDVSLQLGNAISSLMIDSLKVTTDAFHETSGPQPSFEKIRQDNRRLKELEKNISDDKIKVLGDVDKVLRALENLSKTASEANRTHQYSGAASIQLRDQLRETVLGAVSRVRQLTKMVNEDKNRTAVALKLQRENRVQTEQVLQIALGLEVILSALAIMWFKSDVEKRVGTIYKNTFNLAQGKPLLPEVSGTDEIAQLDIVFRNMADALAKAKRDRRAMVDQSRDVICQFNEQFQIRSINVASTSILSCFPEELIGKNVSDIIHADDAPSVLDKLKQSIASGEQPIMDVRVLKKDGSAIDTLWSTRWSPSDRSFFGVIHDNTQKKRAERLRQDVLQMVNHDLRTPLFTVSSFLEMVQMGVFGTLTEAGTKQLITSLSGTSSMLVLIEDLLDFEKLEAGMLELSSEHMDLKRLVDDVVETIREWLPGLTIEVPDDVAGNLSKFHVQGDTARLQQVLQKLIAALAAVDAEARTPASEKNSVVKLSVAEQGTVLITLTLAGVRIPDDVLAGMFDPYAETNEYFARHERNSRMMLAVCRALVQLRGGTLTVLNQSDSCGFEIRIPKI